MKYLTQHEHKQFIQNLRNQGYSMPEIITILPGESPYGKCKEMLENVPDTVIDMFKKTEN